MVFDHGSKISRDHTTVLTPETTVLGYLVGILYNIREYKLNVRAEAGFRFMNGVSQLRVP